MKRTLLFIACVLTSLTMLAQDGLYGEWWLVGWNDGGITYKVNTSYVSKRHLTIEIPKEGYVKAYSMVNEIFVGLLTLSGNEMIFDGEMRGAMTEVYCGVMENVFFESHICDIKSYQLDGNNLRLYYTDNDYFVFTKDFDDSEEQNDYLPFVEAGKQWHVVISYAYENINGSPYYGCSHSKYRMYEEVERNGKTYLHAARILIAECENQDAGLYREENRRVYKYDEATGRDIMLYDFSLKEGDTFTYEFGLDQPVNCKVLKQGWLTEGPKIATSSSLVADTLETNYRWLRTWTIGRDNGSGKYDEVATWVECIGALENVFGLIDNGYMKFDSNLAYVERTDHETGYSKNEYLPFSFYTIPMHGCNMPTGESHAEYDDRQHHLTYELEGNRLHIYGDVYTQYASNNYAFIYEKPTDDPLVHEISLTPWEVSPDIVTMSYHHTDFYVPGFDPNLNYYVYGEDHPVINKTPQMAYRPFVEEGKVWVVGGSGISPDGYSLEPWIEYCYFDGDTIIGGQTCKQMKCISNSNPSPLYIGAWYEQDKKVYFAGNNIEREDMKLYFAGNRPQFELLYDFTLSSNDSIYSGDYLLVAQKLSGGIVGFKDTYYNLWHDGRLVERWFEGIGSNSWPYINHPYIYYGVGGSLLACVVGDEVIYYSGTNEHPYIMNAPKSRFDFTHIIKDKPKAPKRRGAEQSLYGEYNNVQLGINLDPIDDAYLIRISNEAGKVVYEKAINAGNIVGLNIDISAYSQGRYTVTIENSRESFTGEFDTIITGIVEVKSKNFEVRDGIYNLQGQRISTLQKGFNIVNGKKVYVK